jgi:hypothetical protein
LKTDSMIYKYPLTSVETEVSTMPGSEVVYVGEQDGTIMVWIRRPTEAIALGTTMRFRIFATGEIIPKNAEYIGTVQMRQLVWHVFKI